MGAPREPVPAPVLEAMREWLRRNEIGRYIVRGYSEQVTAAVETAYPGGVSGFLRDHGNEGGEG